MHAQVGIRVPFLLVVNPEERLISREEATGQQLSHGMELIFDLDADLAASIQELPPRVRVHKVQDQARKGMQSDRRQPCLFRSLRPIAQRQIVGRDHDTAGLEEGSVPNVIDL